VVVAGFQASPEARKCIECGLQRKICRLLNCICHWQTLDLELDPKNPRNNRD
jgi:hypothetical protein